MAEVLFWKIRKVVYLNHITRRLCIASIFLGMVAMVTGCTSLAMLSKFRTGKPAHSKVSSIIPFELKGHFILVPVTINGCQKELTFIVDTCAPTIIDKRIARELHIAEGREIPLSNGSEAFLSKKKVDVRFGEVQVKDLRILLIDMDIYQVEDGRSIHGFVGSDILRHFRVTFDYRARRIVLEQSKSVDTGAITTRFSTGSSVPDSMTITESVLLDTRRYTIPSTQSFPMHWPKVQCKLDGNIVSEAFIDTGSPVSIVAPVSLIERQSFTQERTLLESNGIILEWPSAFSDTLERNYFARLDSLQIGDLIITKLPLIYANSGFILLGKSFLSRFVATIDYPAEELILNPYPDLSFDQNVFSTGLHLKSDKQNRTVVEGFWKGSPADRIGLLPGDEVLSINSMDVGALTDLEISRLLNDETITIIELVVKERESERRVSLEKEMLFPKDD